MFSLGLKAAFSRPSPSSDLPFAPRGFPPPLGKLVLSEEGGKRRGGDAETLRPLICPPKGRRNKSTEELAC